MNCRSGVSDACHDGLGWCGVRACVENGDKKWKITHENNHSFIPEDELEDWVVPRAALDASAALVEPFLSSF